MAHGKQPLPRPAVLGVSYEPCQESVQVSPPLSELDSASLSARVFDPYLEASFLVELWFLSLCCSQAYISYRKLSSALLPALPLGGLKCYDLEIVMVWRIFTDLWAYCPRMDNSLIPRYVSATYVWCIWWTLVVFNYLDLNPSFPTYLERYFTFPICRIWE